MEQQPAPPATPTPTPPFPKEMVKSQNSLLIVLIATILVLLGVIGYLVYQNMMLQKQIATLSVSPLPEPSIAPSPSLIDTTNWKTYTNTNYGYRLKYPSTFSLSNCKEGLHFFTVVSGLKSSEFCETPPFGVISLLYSSSSLTFSESDEFKVEDKEITIDGVKAIKQTVEKIKDAPGPDYAVYVSFSKNSYYYLLSLRDKEYEDTFDQILSTFKFIQ